LESNPSKAKRLPIFLRAAGLTKYAGPSNFLHPAPTLTVRVCQF
jgi:hypothetical protein